MTYQLASLPRRPPRQGRPCRSSRSSACVPGLGASAAPPWRCGSPRPSGLAAAAREAEAWRERTRRFEAALALPARPRPPAAGPGEGARGSASHPISLLPRPRWRRAGGAANSSARGEHGRSQGAAYAFWLARRRTRLSLKEIGAGLRRDHTSVLHGVRRCEAIAGRWGRFRWAPVEAAVRSSKRMPGDRGGLRTSVRRVRAGACRPRGLDGSASASVRSSSARREHSGSEGVEHLRRSTGSTMRLLTTIDSSGSDELEARLLRRAPKVTEIDAR